MPADGWLNKEIGPMEMPYITMEPILCGMFLFGLRRKLIVVSSLERIHLMIIQLKYLKMQCVVLFHLIETTNWQAAEQIIEADRETRGTRFTNRINYYRSKLNKPNPAPRYRGLVPPLDN